MQWLKVALLSMITLMVLGCDGSKGKADLDRYMREMRARPTGSIEPLPTFKPYEVFTYKASGMRSPFTQPLLVKANNDGTSSYVTPNTKREKDYLEQFDIESFSLVGSISNEEGIWGLVRGNEGVHRVEIGDYIGRNHGRIEYIDDQELRIVEIVPVGADLWVERPRSLIMESP